MHNWMDYRGEQPYAESLGGKLVHSLDERKRVAWTIPSEHGRDRSSQIIIGLVELDSWLVVGGEGSEDSFSFFLDDSKDNDTII